MKRQIALILAFLTLPSAAAQQQQQKKSLCKAVAMSHS